MKYHVKQGGLASIVVCNGVDFIYFGEQVPPGRKTPGDEAWEALPISVQKAIKEQFKSVFSKPVSQWTPGFLRSFSPLEFDIEDENTQNTQSSRNTKAQYAPKP